MTDIIQDISGCYCIVFHVVFRCFQLYFGGYFNLTHSLKTAIQQKESAEKQKKLRAPLKTNMSPENQWLEDVFPT